MKPTRPPLPSGDLMALLSRLTGAGVNSLRQAEILGFIIERRRTTLSEVVTRFNLMAGSAHTAIRTLIHLGLVSLADQPAGRDQRVQPLVATTAATALFSDPEPEPAIQP